MIAITQRTSPHGKESSEENSKENAIFVAKRDTENRNAGKKLATPTDAQNTGRKRKMTTIMRPATPVLIFA